MLTTYQTQTTQLLQNPAAQAPLYSESDIASYINRARQQVAGEGECIRVTGTLALPAANQVFPFSSIDTGAKAVTGIGGVNALRQVLIGQGVGYRYMTNRAWEWFTLYHLNDINPQSGQPATWSQLGQGQIGTLWVSPIPATDYTALCDVAALPIDLVDDTTVEAIPALWTVAVPFFAAYLALLSAQSGTRQGDADRMLERYSFFMQRARLFATPSVLPVHYPQNVNLPAVAQAGAPPGTAA